MLEHEESFRHWAYRGVAGDATAVEDTAALLRALFRQGRLRAYRARFYRPSGWPGVRQAVLIDLGRPLEGTDPFGTLHALWLVEQSDRRVFVYRCDRAPRLGVIGGKVMRDVPALEPQAAWYARLAETAARRVLGYDPSDPADAQPGRRHALALLVAVERALLADAVSQFTGGLASDLLDAIRSAGPASPEIYNFYWTGDGQLARRRVQALGGFAFFGETLRSDWRVRRSVDSGEPLVRALAAAYQVNPRTIRHCRARSAERLSSAKRAELVSRLDQLPAEYLPATEADWQAFVALGEPLADLAALLHADLRHFVSPFAQGWSKGHQALSQTLGMPFNTAEIETMMRATYRYGVAPVLTAARRPGDGRTDAPRDPPAGFFPAWFGGYGLSRLADLSRGWRLGYAQFSLARLGIEQKAAGLLTWTPLLPRAASHTHARYRVVELTSQQALELEGRAQGHCVASYAATCLEGDAAIFSVRDRRTGQVFSTFEIGLREDRPTLSKHYGYANQAPGPVLAALVNRFVVAVLQPLATTHIEAVRAERRARGAEIVGLLVPSDTPDTPLSAEERARLAQLVAHAHPNEARRRGLLPFLRKTEYLCGPLQADRPVGPQSAPGDDLRLAA
jgi:hypothetical protein